MNERSLLHIVSKEKLLIVLNRIETLTNIYFIKRDMYSFCVNLYKYVNSTGIADGLFDWLLKCCCTTTLAWKTTLSQRWGRAKFWNRKQDFWGRRGHKDLKDGEEQCFSFRKRVGTLRKTRWNEKRANVRQRSEEPSCYWEKSGNSPIWKNNQWKLQFWCFILHHCCPT